MTFGWLPGWLFDWTLRQAGFFRRFRLLRLLKQRLLRLGWPVSRQTRSCRGVAARAVDGCGGDAGLGGGSTVRAGGQRNDSSADLQCVNGQVNATFRGLKEPVAVESA